MDTRTVALSAELFTPKFLEYKEGTTELKVPFPLPQSPETLGTFLQGEQGKPFREGLIALMGRLTRWLQAQGMTTHIATCESFKRIYTEYSGNDADVNKMYYALYTQGLPHLAGICDLLEGGRIPLTVCQDTIANLITGITVCPPGSSTNIADTYWKLAAQLNVPIELMAARRQIVQQLLLESLQFLKQETALPDEALVGMEIHYVNMILNLMADDLSVKAINDPYTAICNPIIAKAVFEIFAPKLIAHFNAEGIIAKIIFERNVDKFLNSDFKFDKIREFELAMDRYGNDPAFSFQELIQLNDDGSAPKPFWYATYCIYLTLLNRLVQSGYFTLEKALKTETLPNNDVLHYCQHDSLKLAWATVNGKRIPLIPYCVEVLENNQPAHVEALMNFLLINTSDAQRFDVVQGILAYMHYHLKTPKAPGWLAKWTQCILNLEPEGYQFDSTLKGLPQAAHEIYFQQLGHDKLVKLIKNGNQLVNVLSVLSKDEGIDLLHRHIGKANYPRLITNAKHLAQVLSVLLVSQWDELFKALGQTWTVFMRQKNINKKLLAVLFQQLPPNEWDVFFKKYSNKSWRSCITQIDQLIAVLHDLPADKWDALFAKLNGKRLINLIGEERVLLFFTSAHWQRLYALLEGLTPAKCSLVLRHFGSDNLYELLSGRIFNSFGYLIQLLPNEKSTALLDAISPKKLDEMLTTTISSFDLIGLLEHLSHDKITYFLNYLGRDRVVRLLQKGFYPMPHISGLLPQDIEAVMNFIGPDNIKLLIANYITLIAMVKGTGDKVEKIDTLCKSIPADHLRELGNQLIAYYLVQAFKVPSSTISNVPTAEILPLLAKNEAKIKETLHEDWLSEAQETALYNHLHFPARIVHQCMMFRFLMSLDERVIQHLYHPVNIDPLVEMILDNHLAPFLQILNKEACVLLFKLIGEGRRELLLTQLHAIVQQAKSFAIFAKLPESLATPLLTRFTPQVMATFAQTQEQLIAVCHILPSSHHLSLLTEIGDKQLGAILLGTHSVKSVLTSLENCRKNHSPAYETLLLALLRARKYQLAHTPASFSLFKPPAEHQQAYALLDAAIAKDIAEGHHAGLAYFRQELAAHHEQEAMFHDGDIHKLSDAFQASGK